MGRVGAHYNRVSKLREGWCGGGWHEMRRVRAKARASVGVLVCGGGEGIRDHCLARPLACCAPVTLLI